MSIEEKAAVACIAFVGVFLVACPATCPPPYPPEPEVATFESKILADCRLACESMAKVGCPESAPSGDRSCGEVCTTAVANHFPMPTICVAAASTKDQIRACGVRCRE